MPKTPIQPEELRKQIEDAFAEVAYPGDDQLVLDSSGYHLECNQVAAVLKGKHWKQVPLDLLRQIALAALTPEAYRFYLPAFLVAGSLHYDEADLIPDSVVFSLLPPSDPHDIVVYGEIDKKRREIFTPAQRAAVRAFLEFLKQYHAEDDPLGDVDRAIESLNPIS